jgi:hypothetical protein
MASQTPFILADNQFDRINLYPAAVLASTAAVVGREVNYVADYRRERTYFQAASAAAGHAIDVDMGAGNTAQPNTLFIDRGHNLWGQVLTLRGSDDAFATNPVALVLAAIPAIGSVGGDPAVGWCVTEEGAIYTFVAPATARRYWRIFFGSAPAAAIVVPGIILGQRTQLLSYSAVLDEDAGKRSYRQQESLIPGYYGRERSYAQRTLQIQLHTICFSRKTNPHLL